MLHVPVEWLRSYVPVKWSPEELAHRLTMAGFEVTEITKAGSGDVLHLEITPNRADCLSILGLAREVAAISGVALRAPKLPPSQAGTITAPSIRIEDRKGCARYIGRLIEGVRVAPAPAWMQARLAACNIRAINNVVDITNYVLLEYGQPLHAFDYPTLQGGQIVVRRARANEKLAALDDNTYALRASDLVIADATRPVAIAGVMGGQATAVTDRTTRVLLESALFDPISVRRTARGLGLSSESSYRFERGIDPSGVEAASRRASALLAELAGGRETASRDVGERRAKPVMVALSVERASRALGVPQTAADASKALKRLGFRTTGGGKTLRVQAPSYRRDVRQDVDVIEELARLHGYDKLPATIPSASLAASTDGPQSPYRREQALRRICASLGLTEIMTWSLLSDGELAKAQRAPSTPLKLRNPLSQDHLVLRPTLLVGALRAAAKAFGQGALGVRQYELGHVFDAQPELRAARETLRLGVAIAGVWERGWQSAQSADFFRLKGVLEALAGRTRGGALELRAAPIAGMEPGHGAELFVDRQRAGWMGRVARAAAEAFHVDAPLWFAELDAEALWGAAGVSRAQAPSAFPPVKRDLSILIDKSAGYAALRATIEELGRPLAGRIELIDRYADKAPVPADKQSLTFSIEYRDPSRTLTAEEVDARHRAIAQALSDKFGAQLR